MYIKLKDKNLNNSFVKSFTEFSKIDNIQDWIFLYDTTLTEEYSINYIYVLVNPEKDKVAIYFAGFDKYLIVQKKFKVFSAPSILSNNFDFSEAQNLDLNIKMKDFQLFYLNQKLSEKLVEKYISIKKNKI